MEASMQTNRERILTVQRYVTSRERLAGVYVIHLRNDDNDNNNNNNY